ncbi:MAG TPA: sensor histidine kinase [Conexibacter sp.]|jgi:signal transduction histidine kinase
MTLDPAPDPLRLARSGEARAGSRATSSRRRSLTLAVGEVAVTALLGGLGVLAVLYSGVAHPPPWQAALFVVGGWAYVAAGTVAWVRRPSCRIGLLMTAGGFAWLAVALANSSVPALATVGMVVGTLPVAIVIHLLLAFPSGRLGGPAAHAAALAGYFACLVLQAPVYLFTPPSPVLIQDSPSVADAGLLAQRIVGAMAVIATSVIVGRSLRAATPAQRRLLAPLSVYGIVAVLAFPAGPAVADLLFNGGGLTLFIVQMTVMTGVPIAFAVAALRGGFARTGEIEELGAWLGADDASRPQLTDLLAAALGDRSVELLFRVPGEQGWVNGAGVFAVPPAASAGRSVTEVELAGETIGAIVYDATLLPRSQEVRDFVRVVALALDRERLTVELRASRARLVEAGDAERRRIARDLHDGIQSRLVLLSVQAGVAAGVGAGVGEPTADAVTELRLGIATAIDELRALVHGVMPAELTERGLAAAVEALADRMPIEVTLDLGGLGVRLPPTVESTGYFVISEALVNAVKHARASELAVTLSLHDGERLRIEVRDDGIGGAGSGHGTRSMSDRVEALGGKLRIDSATGAGTRVYVELPCGS